MVSVRLCFDEHGTYSNPKGEDEIRNILAHPGALVWLDVDRDHLGHLKPFDDLIHLHPLAVEDAESPHQRPILNRYDGTIFLVLYELTMAEGDNTIRGFPISFFVGQNYVVTARDIERSTLDDVAKRWQEFGQHTETHTPGFLLSAIIDALVDNYFPAVETLGNRIEALEERLLQSDERMEQKELHAVRKQLFEVRRVLAPGREVLNELIRRDTPLIDEKSINYFHDVYDHVLRVLDWMDAYREMAGTLFEMQLTMSSHRLDQSVRTLTVASIILMSASLIAGIYGMNFDNMPELGWRLGYPIALGMMLLSANLLFVFFRRRRWL